MFPNFMKVTMKKKKGVLELMKYSIFPRAFFLIPTLYSHAKSIFRISKPTK